MVQHVPLALAEPRDELLARSPLRLVVFQLRFTPVETAGDLRSGLSAQEVLGGPAAWRLEPIQTQSFSISAGPERPASGGTVEIGATGWRLVAEDGGAVVSLLPDSISFEVTAYPGWAIYRRVIGGLLTTTAEVLRPQAETRVALRYINRLDQPVVQSAAEWSDLIDSNVLGILNHAVGPSVTAAQQQLQVRIGDSEKATVQHGFLRDPVTNRLTYLMDFDVFRDGARAFDPVDTGAAVDALHHVVLQLFQSFITAKLYAFLKSE